jgi:catechol 1,2-dioxygenase
MTESLIQTPRVQSLLDKISGLDTAEGNPRTKKILRRIVSDLFSTVDEFDITPDEFWATLSFLQNGAQEFGLIAPGLGFDHFLDIRMDEVDRKAGITGGTPRTIEGPLYVAGAPLVKGFARLDDGTDQGKTLVMRGTVRDTNGKPIAGAIVDVWHTNTIGRYSHFDPSQSLFNNRRRIETGDDGNYGFQSVVPSGYAVPPNGAADLVMKAVGRHGQRPAHIHFFVLAPGHRHLTTQINLAGDPFLYEDFAFATRDELIVETVEQDGHTEMTFDFVLLPARDPAEVELSARLRASA